ncbi:uncharacterized protein BJ171DRAFT_195899 [Polychytrium aggregatum]|uniref:uncharacterized protein n=1 Tax=Polychytrium aggregatum TaxID=110093 RepID=UPI0022FDC70C|nr:uncharacterized protein BJ171DRAFT_195899 [Polychytrium aggregatum]KAI9201807.1 hypothetical protein BJ171DRAFT_195899 [Polychytrium aggregatum]
MLDYPQSSSLVPEGAKGSYRISYGSDSAPSPSLDFADLKSSVDWLRNSNVELHVVPRGEALEPKATALEDAVCKGDVVIYVTDNHHQLATQSEVDFFKQVYASGRPNVVLAVNQATDLSDEQTKLVEERVSARLAAVRQLAGSKVSNESVQVLVTSAQQARRGQELGSGVGELRTTVLSFLNSAGLERARQQKTSYLTSQALARLEHDQTQALDLLKQSEEQIQALVKTITSTEARIHSEFKIRDLIAVDQSLALLTTSLRSYFDQVKYWKLFWRSDFLASDLQHRMRECSLNEAENRMIYSIGKLNQGLVGLYDQVQQQLEILSSPTSPLAQHPITRELQQDIQRILEIVEKQRPPVNEVDPMKLRNQVAAFDESKQGDELQNVANRLVRTSVGVQLAVLSLGLLFTHLGVPWAISIPSTILASGLGFGWMGLRWTSMTDRFISRIGGAQKTLKEKLAATYEEDFTRVAGKPLRDLIKLFNEASSLRTKKATDRLQQIRDAQRSIEQLKKLQ